MISSFPSLHCSFALFLSLFSHPGLIKSLHLRTSGENVINWRRLSATLFHYITPKSNELFCTMRSVRTLLNKTHHKMKSRVYYISVLRYCLCKSVFLSQVIHRCAVSSWICCWSGEQSSRGPPRVPRMRRRFWKIRWPSMSSSETSTLTTAPQVPAPSPYTL